MDIVFTVICVSIVLGILVVLHEGGHFLAARAFGVRVTEFMVGFPGPSLSVQRGETKFGVTCVPLGGYARICGMEPGKMSPYLSQVLAAIFRRGTAYMEDIAADCSITNDEAYEALEELVEWGCITGPTKHDEFNCYRTVAYAPTKRQIAKAQKKGIVLPLPTKAGEPRFFESEEELFEREFQQQYRSKPFWVRSIILLAGIFVNLLFALLAIVVIYSVIGVDYVYETGEMVHINVPVFEAIQAGLSYIALVAQAVISLFNPQTAAETVSNSTSIIGIAVYSKVAAEAGFLHLFEFTAMISVSLGLMNLLPIPPLDGGRFIVEIIQKISGKDASPRVINMVTTAGMMLFLLFFVVMISQDVSRFVFGNWG